MGKQTKQPSPTPALVPYSGTPKAVEEPAAVRYARHADRQESGVARCVAFTHGTQRKGALMRYGAPKAND